MLRLRAETMPAVTVPPRPKRIADGHHPVADPHLFAVAELDRLQGLRRLDPEHGDIDLGILADHLGAQLLPIGEDHRHLVGVGDHVIVGDDDARRVDDEPRA